MAISCSDWAQWAFVCLSTTTLVGGTLLLGVGIAALVDTNWQLVQLVSPPLYPAVGAVLAVVGVLVAGLSVLAICGSRLQDRRLLRVFFWALLLILVVSGMALVVGFAMGALTSLNDVRGMLLKSMGSYSRDGSVRRQWDDMQSRFQCCGVESAADWLPVRNHYDDVPTSCCQPVPPPTRCTLSNAFNVGCAQKISDITETYSAVIGSVGVAVAVVLLIAMVAAYAIIKNSAYTNDFASLTGSDGPSEPRY